MRSSKRTLRVASFLRQVDEDRAIYPKGIIAALRELSPPKSFTKFARVEWFADQQMKEEKGSIKRKFGILREFFPAFSSEPKLLRLAGISSNVIEVHANSDKDKQRQQANISKTVFADKLILKEAGNREEVKQGVPLTFGEHAPELLVLAHWLDVMSLSSGDRVIVSNPREDYEMPPPTPSIIKRR
jgi:hypothetical protein